MLADYFTKLLQGATFRKFRDAIMNCNFVRPDVHPSDHRSVLDLKHANRQAVCPATDAKPVRGSEGTDSVRENKGTDSTTRKRQEEPQQ